MRRMKRILFIPLLFLLCIANAQSSIQYQYAAKEVDKVPAQVSEYVAKKYPKATNITFSKTQIEWTRWELIDVYVVELCNKNQATTLQLTEDGQLVRYTKVISLERLPSFAKKYISEHCKNASMLKVERMYTYMVSKDIYDEELGYYYPDKKLVKSLADKFYCVYISCERVNGNKELQTEKFWVDFNKKKQYVGRIYRI